MSFRNWPLFFVSGIKNLKPRTDDTFYLAFLRARKYDHDKAFKLVSNGHIVRFIQNKQWKHF